MNRERPWDMTMQRRTLLAGGLALGGVSAAFLSGCGPSGAPKAGGGGKRTLRIIRTDDLASLDPVYNYAATTKDYAFLTYDQLVALDIDYKPQPQMAEGWSVEDGGKTYVFKLRDGLKWHDGLPVTARDCIASITRWASKDGFGQIMATVMAGMDVIDDRSFRIRLTQPFPLLPDALGKTSGPQCFIMPERVAKVPATTQITESIGSGPYRFLRDKWTPGASAVWERFDGYVPRKEPPSGLAGGRVPAVDRIEWSVISDASTGLAALQSGEMDCWDNIPADLAKVVKASPHVILHTRNKAGGYNMMQLNHLQPPFNNQAIRQAASMAVDQSQFTSVVQPDPAMRRDHPGVYTLDTEYATEDGADILKVKSIEKGKAALKAAGYNGERVVILAIPTGALGGMSEVCHDLLTKLGMNVDMQVTDTATMIQRRTNRDTVDKGGWSLFLNGWTGNDVLNPAVNPMLRGAGLKGYAGWCNDPQLEKLRAQWALAVDPALRKRLATAVQVRALQTLPYIPLGNTIGQNAYRDTVTGMFPAPIPVYWDIGKTS